ncbi:MAG: MFS transporter [Frankiaceae bacterium]|nr:MFS transporter [Frankiaceae bacterium]MBV9369088.1 MFS transporter [Frankiales bacterium]
MQGLAGAERRVVLAVTAAMAVYGVGASAVLPILPLFLRSRHTGDAMIGAVIAAFFVAGVLTQYGAGWLTDRLGHRLVLVAGLAIYAVASCGFLLSLHAGGYVTLRALQGLGSGAVTVAGLSMVAAAIPAERRGRAFSRVFAAQLGGMAIGPVIGSIVGSEHMSWLFVVTAVAAALAVAPVLWGVPSGRPAHDARTRLVVSRGLVGVVLVGVGGGVIGGAYESCWSLLMASRGAAVWQVGMSWTLFAIPFAAVSPLAGRLVDRLDRRWLAGVSMLASAGFAVTYPFLPSPAWLMGLGIFESAAVAIAFPAAQSLLAETAPEAALGRAQGLFTTAETAAIAVAAAVSGYLFSLARWTPFVVAAAIAVGLIAALPVLWRDLVGHATTDASVPLPAPMPEPLITAPN